jgi:hydrogenase/urease accessory protein HupE
MRLFAGLYDTVRWVTIRGLLGRVGFATVVLLAGAQTADAHIVASRLGDFYAGALHPLTDLQDGVLWTALGLLAGSLGATHGRWLVLVLPLGLLLGLSVGLSFDSTWTAPLASAAMMVVLGLLLALGWRINVAALCLIALLLAFMRGVVNAGGVGAATDRVLFGAGLALCGYAFITLMTASTLALRGPDAQPSGTWRDIAIRACGSWITAIGLMAGGFALAS